jgi:hypothetical protein
VQSLDDSRKDGGWYAAWTVTRGYVRLVPATARPKGAGSIPAAHTKRKQVQFLPYLLRMSGTNGLTGAQKREADLELAVGSGSRGLECTFHPRGRSFRNCTFRYFDRCFVDLRDTWLIGQRWGECPSSLDFVCRTLGLGAKLEGVTGADFARLWNGSEEEKQQATEYLFRDVEITRKVAWRLGVLGS